MFREFVSISSSTSNKASASKDINPSSSSIHARLRSSKQQQLRESETLTVIPPSSGQSPNQTQSSPAGVPRAVSKTSARMTRKRAAHLVHLEETASHKAEEGSTHTCDGSGGSVESISQICLCQPDPKIPRPRNAFILYRQRHQQNITAQHPGLPNPEISKIAGELWRAEPDHVKSEWKSLAEEEKSRHAQQYPDYRFQPRHKNRTSPTSTNSDKLRCNKCGGRSIISTSSPFLTPPGSTLGKPTAVTLRGNLLPTPPVTGDTDSSPGRRFPQMLHGLSLASPRVNPRYPSAGSPTARRFPDGTMESSEAKRRRYDAYNSSISGRPDSTRPPLTGSGHLATQYPYPSPRLAHPRRESLPAPNGTSYHVSRNSLGRTSISPSPGTPIVSAPLMGPPPRVTVPSIRSGNGLHAYPPTPTTSKQPHGLPFPGHARHDSETLRLPPLLSPSGLDQSRSIEAMVMSIPYLGKIKLLRRIAPPIKESSPVSPKPRVRGTIIAIEGEDAVVVESVLKHLSDSLNRSEEFDVHVISGPKVPEGKASLKDFITEVATWHERTQEIIDFVTGVDYTREEQRKLELERGNGSLISLHSSPAVDHDEETDSNSTSEGEILEGARKALRDATRRKTPQPQTRNANLTAQKESMQRAVERESRRQSLAQENSAKIPLVLVLNYILHASNTWASALPINDAYSPADHWQWVATLWRGIVGADLTVYVKSAGGEKDREEPVSAGAGAGTGGEGWSSSKPGNGVEMREEVGTIVVKREKGGKVEEGAVRRLAFEVGEWARASAAGVGKGA